MSRLQVRGVITLPFTLFCEEFRKAVFYQTNQRLAPPLERNLLTRGMAYPPSISITSTATRCAIRVGIAGWSLPKTSKRRFPAEGSHLTRYAARFTAVEINSSFYRPHRRATYEKWAASVPSSFRFSVKLPKAITHTMRLRGARHALEAFIDEVSGLGDRLGCVLIQLPPSLGYEGRSAAAFFGSLRRLYPGFAVLEARNASWFEAPAQRLLERHRVVRVAVDPAPVPAAAKPVSHGAAYYRWHGSPRIYYSRYDSERVEQLAAELRAHAESVTEVWCIFDNTAEGAAFINAFELIDALQRRQVARG
jgi:uncharacterized protein YecE (DUF72 family)